MNCTDPNETALDMIESYKQECLAVKVRPIGKVLEQLEVCKNSCQEGGRAGSDTSAPSVCRD